MKFSTGSVLSRSLSVMFRNLIPFLVIGVIVYIPWIVIAVMISSGVSEDSAMIAALALLVVQILLGFVMTGAITYGVFQDLSGNRAGIGACLSVGFARMLPVLGVSLLAGLAIGIGTLLLVVPGVILACMLYVAVPAAVVEKPGVMGALSRSADLTRGSRWSVFAIVLVIGVLNQVVGRILNGAVDATDAILFVVLTVVVVLFFSIWSSVTQAVAYHDLRKEKEGIGIEDLVKVFD